MRYLRQYIAAHWPTFWTSNLWSETIHLAAVIQLVVCKSVPISGGTFVDRSPRDLPNAVFNTILKHCVKWLPQMCFLLNCGTINSQLNNSIYFWCSTIKTTQKNLHQNRVTCSSWWIYTHSEQQVSGNVSSSAYLGTWFNLEPPRESSITTRSQSFYCNS